MFGFDKENFIGPKFGMLQTSPPLKMNLVPEIRVAHGIGMVILLSKNPLISRGLPLWWVYPLFNLVTLLWVWRSGLSKL